MTLSREFYFHKDYSAVDCLGSDAVIFAGDKVAIAFHGRKNKPDWHFTFKTNEQRDERIKDFIDSRNARKIMMSEIKEEREKPHTLKVGDILYSSWGYDQTNIDFYQVIKTTRRTVTIREIAQKIDSSEMTSDNVIAVKDAFCSEPMRKTVDGKGNYVKIESFAYAYLWDGTPKHQTNTMFGH